MTPIHTVRFLPAPLALLLAAVPLAADLVRIDNGDALRGQIDKVHNGKLYLKTDYAGTIQIAWARVTEVVADGRYEVEVRTGRRYKGEVRREGDMVSVAEEDVFRDLPSPEVVAVVRLDEDDERPGFWQALEGNAGMGYSFSRGNSDQTQVSVSADASLRRPKYRVRSDLRSIFSRQGDAATNSRHAWSGRYDRFLSERAFAFGLAGLESNERQRLELRSRFGGGFGWTTFKSRTSQFDLLGGFTFTNEQFSNGDGEMLPRASTGEGLLGFEWRSTRFRKIELTTRLTAHPNTTQGGRYRIEYDSGVRIPVINGLTWNVNLFDRFDSEPPREGVRRNDYGLVSTVGFSF